MASEALGLLPVEMQEQFPAGACTRAIAKNERRLPARVPSGKTKDAGP